MSYHAHVASPALIVAFASSSNSNTGETMLDVIACVDVCYVPVLLRHALMCTTQSHAHTHIHVL